MFKLKSYLRPYLKESILGPFFKLLEAILELLLPTIVALIINHGIGEKDTNYVLKMGSLMLIMTVLGFGCAMICQYYAARASQGFGTSLRDTLFKHIFTFSHKEMDRFGTSSLVNRITNDVNQLQVAVAMLIRLVIRAPFICIGAIIMSMILDFRLALIVLASTPIFAIVLYLVITKSSPLYRSYQKKLDQVALVLSENLNGVRVIRAFAKRRAERQRFHASSDDVTQTALRVGKISSLLSPATSFVVNGTIIIILWVSGFHIESGTLSQGEVIAFINYVTQILLALIVVSNLVILFTKASSSAARINEVLAVQGTIADGESYTQSKEQDATSAITPKIEFKQVSFGYNSTGDLALQDVSVAIYPGQTVGIIGGTGMGKSTFVNLIPRFYDVSQGEVLVDGVNVKDYPLIELRNKMGIVPQKALLFYGTIAENIRWGKDTATDEQIKLAAQIAQADEFISKLPDGYETMIERGGKNLSGGQKQRLTIARAVVANPEILILDDSASALDFATDAALRQAISKYSAQSTVLLVSQRVSTVQHADQIIVFDEGRIVGIGRHEELVDTCEVYREVYVTQQASQGVTG
ncbi:ATP-binding cassette subfamily B protein [Paenibacillus turicensis]|uniref:ATP-binding cassette subfamily B protein n=1 Tax=Paenibacillus turicensis TaxID=160487 RepID=A0ABS4FM72_9BACL|nr:ABC transporter ATP-binding protein [Paenibacillus turicensis]MBP1903680.1 ATP-binding cassette subfamily B protein [Paenibacillus turicensis]